MNIKQWPKAERPREKLLLHGASVLSDAELLAIFFRVGIKGKSVLEIARDCLKQTGGLRAFFNLDKATFCQIPGLSLAKYAELQAILEINQRYLDETLKHSDIFQNSVITKKYLKACLRDYSHEVFACLFLDNQNRLIKYHEISQGTINEAAIYPREVVKCALEFNAAQVIFAHNHPSGVAQASDADKTITKHLTQALALIHVRVLDHFIVADNEILSFAEQGLL